MGYALFLKMRGTDDQISLGYTVTQSPRFCRCWFEHAHLALGVGSTARITVRRVVQYYAATEWYMFLLSTNSILEEGPASTG